MSKPTKYQIGCLYKLEDGNVGRAVQKADEDSTSNPVYTLKSYDGSTFTARMSDLRIAKKKDMKHYHRAASALTED